MRNIQGLRGLGTKKKKQKHQAQKQEEQDSTGTKRLSPRKLESPIIGTTNTILREEISHPVDHAADLHQRHLQTRNQFLNLPS